MHEEKEKGIPGQPQYEPTSLERQKVIAFVCAGFNQEQIANYLDIDDKTLRKHFRYELDKSKMDKTIILSNNLYKDAAEGDKQAREFWLKCQARWAYAKPPEETEKEKQQLSLMEKLIDKL